MRRDTGRRAGLLATATAFALAVTATALPGISAAAAPAGSHSVPLGFDLAACPGNALATVQRWQGAPVRVGSTSLPWTSWDTMYGYAPMLDCWAGRPSSTQVQWGLPLIPATGATMAGAAAGDYDQYWRDLGTALVHGTGKKGSAEPNAILRIGWEFNGDWVGWSMGTTAASQQRFVNAFRHAVTALRSIPGQHFTIVWNLTVGSTIADARKAYPGDKYVDVVGLDDYDGSWVGGTYPIPKNASAKNVAARQARSWAYKLYQSRFGFTAWSAFAAQHHKKVALSEWGLMKRTDEGGHGGGDDPVYVHGVFAWARSLGAKHQLSYIAYLNQLGAFDSRLNTPGTKAATAAYRAEAKVSGK
jgi:hypothetical protein